MDERRRKREGGGLTLFLLKIQLANENKICSLTKY